MAKYIVLRVNHKGNVKHCSHEGEFIFDSPVFAGCAADALRDYFPKFNYVVIELPQKESKWT